MTISELAREFGLSRGTLLHYDAIGLLTASGRSDSGYRLYAPADVERLRRICLYRQAGMGLGDIRRLLDADQCAGYAAILQRRLDSLGEEISTLRRQQRLIVSLLAKHGHQKEDQMLNKEQFVALMRATGLTDDDMHRWHAEFEKMSGESHAEFLASLGCGADEIKKIREWSRK
jgi:DNA-binding transcriptional MerR regulator